MEERIVALADFVWSADQVGGIVLLVLLVGTGLYLTVRMGLPQIRYFGHALALVAGRYDNADDPGEVSHFQALSAALSGTVGIGNIAGVATAIYFGGPGAVFWLWVTAAVGMATKFTECTLAVKFRVENPDGTTSGGPMYSIARGMHERFKFLGWLFAGAATLASFGIGNMVQANTVAVQVHTTVRDQLGLEAPQWVTGLVMAALLSLVIVGGIRRISKVASLLVPLMTLLYVGGALVVAAVHWDRLPEALGLIFQSAFNGTAATGGFLGAGLAQAIRWGVARGTFSNEAGLGSSPIAHAAARTNEPVREGLVAMLEPFIDTLCICTLTALAIVSTGVWHEKVEQTFTLADQTFYKRAIDSPDQAAEAINNLSGVIRVRRGEIQASAYFFEGRSSIDNPQILDREGEPFSGVLLLREGRLASIQLDTADRELVNVGAEEMTRLRLRGLALANGPTLTAAAFDHAFPGGQLLVTLALILFAFSTAISWSYYGDRCVGFLFGIKAVLPYRIIFSVVHFLGAIFAVQVVWALADIANAVMAFPNLLSLWALAPLAALMRRQYFGLAPKATEDDSESPPRKAPKKRRKRKA
jgi:AGCS family alanine or glycine:cation symporter